jgi:hypothetical protein
MLCACSSLHVFSKEDSEERARQLDAVQLKVMRFADEYVGQISGPLNTFQAQTMNPRERLDAQNWKVSQATAAYSNASEANPVVAAIDMVVLAVLSRMVVDDVMASPSGRMRSVELRDAHQKLERRAWEFSESMMDEQQRTALRDGLHRWHAANPEVRAVSLIHFADVSQTAILPEKEGFMSRGLLGLIGIEPLGGLDPAVREIAQTRQLAQRSIYYIQRMPALLDMQVERLAYQLTVMPESRQVLDDVDHVADAAERVGRLADALPTVFSQERETTIAQIGAQLSAQQGKTRALARDLRELLEAGTLTSSSVNTTIRSLDALVARFKSSGPASAAPSTAVKNDTKLETYSKTLRELSTTAQELQALIVTLDQSTSVASGKSMIDYIVLRAIILALALALIVVGSVLACRIVSRRLRFPVI